MTRGATTTQDYEEELLEHQGLDLLAFVDKMCHDTMKVGSDLLMCHMQVDYGRGGWGRGGCC